MTRIKFGGAFFRNYFLPILSETITDIFFDLDHTLWDFDRNSALAFERVFRKHQIDINLAKFIKEYEPINLIYWKKFREETVTKEEMRRGRLVDAFRIFNRDFPISSIDLIAKSYIEELPLNNYLFDGTHEILGYLAENFKLHIITNGFEEVQHLKLRKSGIEMYFDTITTSEEVGVKKPNPVIFTTAMTKASANPENSLMIGDNWEADILGAKNVGMHILFFNPNFAEFDSSFPTINSLDQIKGFL